MLFKCVALVTRRILRMPRFDPSNPVVCYDGSLKSSLFSKMREAADSADLVLVLGTSLSGLNSDRVALQPAKRSLAGKSLGTVIVNLQQTPHDGVATLRLFGGTDRVFELLMGMISPPLEICPLITPPQVQVHTGSFLTHHFCLNAIAVEARLGLCSFSSIIWELKTSLK